MEGAGEGELLGRPGGMKEPATWLLLCLVQGYVTYSTRQTFT